MLLIRRLWLAPAVLIFLILYYLFHVSLSDHVSQTRNQTPADMLEYARSQMNKNVHLKPHKDWFPVKSHTPLPSGRAEKIPEIQFDFRKKPESAEAKKVRLGRKAAVEEAFSHAWEGYKFHAFGKDEVTPISGRWKNSFGGWGATMIDTMDALWMLGMKDEFEMCVATVKKIDFTTNTESYLNLFESTIRYLGGLLSAYDVSGQKYSTLLKKAIELGDVLLMAFDTPTRMPVTRWDWKAVAEGTPNALPPSVLIAEVGSLSVEFTRLSQLTRDPKYYDAIQRISTVLYKAQNTTNVPGLWPTAVNIHDYSFNHNHFTLGAMADSTYEYLPKEYMLLGGLDQSYRTMYETAIEAAKRHLFFRPMTPTNADILVSGNTVWSSDKPLEFEGRGEHLGCFVGGMVAIGAKIFDRPGDMSVARKLVDGCVWNYDSMASGLMPEVFHMLPCYVGSDPDISPTKAKKNKKCKWNEDKWYEGVASLRSASDATAKLTPVEAGKHWVKEKDIVKGYVDLPDNRYILRPEAIESVFILYRITGDESLLDIAWRMFQSADKATRTNIGHAVVLDVRSADSPKFDSMESFWLAETLKYYWLIFAETDEINLDEWVFNTEAHPMKRPKPGDKL